MRGKFSSEFFAIHVSRHNIVHWVEIIRKHSFVIWVLSTVSPPAIFPSPTPELV
jgi:hypothetical protein